MARIATALAAAVLLVFGASACGGTEDSGSAASEGAPVAKGGDLEPADITLWAGFTQRELGVVKAYGTAPVPVDDDNPDLYGGGYTTGNIIGIPKRAEHQEQGWALLKFLASDDQAQVLLSNGLRNVPTTESSAKSPDLKPDPKFDTFVKIFANPNTTTTPVTAAGSAYQELFNNFVNKWQAGRVDDLQAGLADVDKQIDAQLANVQGEQVP